MSSTIPYKYYPTKKATIITAPFSGGQPKGGVELGPEYILKAGFQKQIESLGWASEIDSPLEGTDYEKLKSNEKIPLELKTLKLLMIVVRKSMNLLKNH